MFAAACQKNEGPVGPSEPKGRAVVINDEGILALRLTGRSDTIGLDSSSSGRAKRSASGADTSGQWKDGILIAEIAPPVVDGVTLQATSVALDGQFAYVSYSLKGEQFAGAVDVVHIRNGRNAVLRSEIIIKDSKVHGLCFSRDTLYLAQATSDPSFVFPAVLEKFGIQGGKLNGTSAGRIGLGSFAATSVAMDGEDLWITTGNTGGLYSLSPSGGNTPASIPLSDARWVDFDATRVVVMQGTPGRLSVFEKSTLTLRKTISLHGATLPESKSTVRLKGGKALVAAGNGGAQLISLATGKVVASLPYPIVPGLDSSVTVTNAADGAGYRIYLSNGEAGIYAAGISKPLETDTGDEGLTMTLMGKLKFRNLQSVNHVAFDGAILVVAAGSGGVKIVTFGE